MNAYEILFLFDPTFGASWEAVEGEINRLMGRAKAEVLITKRLEDRRLAYEVKGRKRGLYVLTFFKAAPDRIGGLERDIRISECILRALILRADELTEERMKNATLVGAGHEPRMGREETLGREGGAAVARESADRTDAPGEEAELGGDLITTAVDEAKDPRI